MVYINKRNFFIRVSVALLIIASVWIGFNGGIAYVQAQTMDNVPEPYQPMDPITKDTLRNHISGLIASEYQITYSSSIRTSSKTLQSEKFAVKLSNTNRVGYLVHTKQNINGPDQDLEQYETKKMLYSNKSGTISSKQKDGNVKSPILRNQFVNATYAINEFDRVTWAIESTSNGTITYKLAKASAFNFPYLTTIKSAQGTIKIDKSGRIKHMSLYIRGTSQQYPAETIYINYQYSTSQGDTTVPKPDWIPENSDSSSGTTEKQTQT